MRSISYFDRFYRFLILILIIKKNIYDRLLAYIIRSSKSYSFNYSKFFALNYKRLRIIKYKRLYIIIKETINNYNRL